MNASVAGTIQPWLSDVAELLCVITVTSIAGASDEPAKAPVAVSAIAAAKSVFCMVSPKIYCNKQQWPQNTARRFEFLDVPLGTYCH